MARSRKVHSVVLPLLAWLAAGGCVMSLHPLYESRFGDPGYLLDNALLGTWTAPACLTAYFPDWGDGEKGGTCTLEFREAFAEIMTEGPTRKVRNGYRISVTTEDGRTAALDGNLVRLDEHLFLDTAGIEEPDRRKGPFLSEIHLLRTHNFWKIVPGTNTLSVYPMDSESFSNRQDDAATDPMYLKTDGLVVFTAETPALQKYVRKLADDPKTFLAPTVWRRSARADARESGPAGTPAAPPNKPAAGD